MSAAHDMMSSYGGLLSAWMRFKYPNMVHGALAASAPMYIAANVSNPGGFFQVVTKVTGILR